MTGDRPGSRTFALALVLAVAVLLMLRFAFALNGGDALQRAPESDPSGSTSSVGATYPAAPARSTQLEVEPPTRAVDDVVALSSEVPDVAPSSSEVSASAGGTSGSLTSTKTAVVTFEVVQGWPPLPAVGVELHMERITGGKRRESLRPTTNARGLARLPGLAPGLWEYRVQLESTERDWRGHLALGPGDARHVSLADETEESGLAVFGRFVDEKGAPIQFGRDDDPHLLVCGSGASGWANLGTRADGTFRIYMPRCAEIVVHNFGGHRYEPELARVPFGTRDLVLRRVQRFESRTVVVEVRDSVDRELVTDADLIVYEHHARATVPSRLVQRWNIVERPSEGRLATTLRTRPEMRLAVCADGYASRFLDLPASGATLDAPLVVHLEHGGLREVHVFDETTKQPIEAVELVTFGRAVVATTDGTGRAEFRVDQHRGLTLLRAGYTHEVFQPSGPWDRVFLTPE